MLALAAVICTVNAQVQHLSEMSITPPTFQSGDHDNLAHLIQSSLEYPNKSLYEGIQGTEVIRFTVSGTGTVEHITVINSVSQEIDRVVSRTLEETSGKWKPGTIDGQQTGMDKEIALSFVLYSSENMLKEANYYMLKANRLMFLKDKPGRALEYYNKAFNLYPYDQGVLIAKAFCLQKLGRDEEAEDLGKRIEYRAGKENQDAIQMGEEYTSLIGPDKKLTALK